MCAKIDLENTEKSTLGSFELRGTWDLAEISTTLVTPQLVKHSGVGERESEIIPRMYESAECTLPKVNSSPEK